MLRASKVFGNSKTFKRAPLPAVLERASRSLKASLVLFWGRWGLPVPFKVCGTVVIPLWCRYVPPGNTGTTAATDTTPHTSTTVLFFMCAKQVHRHYTGHPALLNRHFRESTTVPIATCNFGISEGENYENLVMTIIAHRSQAAPRPPPFFFSPHLRALSSHFFFVFSPSLDITQVRGH